MNSKEEMLEVVEFLKSCNKNYVEDANGDGVSSHDSDMTTDDTLDKLLNGGKLGKHAAALLSHVSSSESGSYSLSFSDGKKYDSYAHTTKALTVDMREQIDKSWENEENAREPYDWL